jgi:hypothetical protein
VKAITVTLFLLATTEGSFAANWEYRIAVDPITDARAITLTAQEQQSSPSFGIACFRSKSDNQVIMFSVLLKRSPEPMYLPAAELVVTIDTAPPIRLRVSSTTVNGSLVYKGLYGGEASDNRLFSSLLKMKNRLVWALDLPNNRDEQVISADGSATKIQHFVDSCGLRLN